MKMSVKYTMKTLGSKVKQLRTERGITQEQLAKLSGISRSEISAIERGTQTLGVKRLGKISSALGVPASVFLDTSGEITGPLPVPPGRRALPIRGYVTAGTGLIVEEDILGTMAVLEFEDQPYRPDAYILLVRGDSMEPLINDGSRLVVEPLGDGRQRPRNKIVVARNVGGEMTVKALWRIGRETFLRSLNLEYAPIPLTEKWRIVGIVRTIMNKRD